MTVREITPLSAEQRELVTGSMQVVDKVARALARRYGTLAAFDDMVSMGREGLVQAARVYDSGLGVPFSTFATYRIQGAILDGIRKEAGRAREIRIAAHAAATEFFAVQSDRTDVMTDTEEAQRERLDSFAANAAAAMFAGLIGAQSRRSAAGDEDSTAARDQRTRAIASLERASAELNERDRKLVDLHYKQGIDLKDVAGVLGVSYATVRRYHTAVIQRLAARLRTLGVDNAPPASTRAE
jgi:RNA polymerase sigma factor for flagellar operon FliA